METPKLKSQLKAPPRTAAEDEDRDPTKEELMEDIRIGIRQAKAGLGRPALESLEELRREIYGNGDSR